MPSERMQRQIDGLLDEAEAAVRALDWQTVRDRTEAVLRLDPDNQDASSLLEAARRDGPSEPSGTKSDQAPPAPAVPLPASFAAGRYAVRRFLGEGGRKRVYLAHDERLKRDVAIAVIKTDGLDAQGLSRIQREAEAMAKLGDHANIVTIFDVGDDGDPGRSQPYIVSQYMSGGAVDTLDLPLRYRAHARDCEGRVPGARARAQARRRAPRPQARATSGSPPTARPRSATSASPSPSSSRG